jgi:hypothetical protein
MKEEEINKLIMELENCIFMHKKIKFWRSTMLLKYFEIENSETYCTLLEKVSDGMNNIELHKKEKFIGNQRTVTDELLLSRSFCKRLAMLMPERSAKTSVARKYFNLYHCGIETIKKEIHNN